MLLHRYRAAATIALCLALGLGGPIACSSDSESGLPSSRDPEIRSDEEDSDDVRAPREATSSDDEGAHEDEYTLPVFDQELESADPRITEAAITRFHQMIERHEPGTWGTVFEFCPILNDEILANIVEIDDRGLGDDRATLSDDENGYFDLSCGNHSHGSLLEIGLIEPGFMDDFNESYLELLDDHNSFQVNGVEGLISISYLTDDTWQTGIGWQDGPLYVGLLWDGPPNWMAFQLEELASVLIESVLDHAMTMPIDVPTRDRG